MTRWQEWLAAESAARDAAGLQRALRPRAAEGTTVDLAGNDYLGLSRDPAVVEAAAAAARRWGAGAGASRLVTGTLELHAQLERELAAYLGQPAALVFSTGYHANLSVVAALTDADTLVVSDAHVHASMIDACRLSRAQVEVVGHNDVAAVDAALSARTQERAVVLVETIYSVLGDSAPVRELAEVCAARGAVLVADEAHALGVAGNDGRGLLHAAGLGDRPDVVGTLTLSKSLGAQGGAVLSSGAVRDHLVNRARPFIYDTGLAPAAAGGALAALRVVEDEPQRVARVNEVSAVLAEACGVGQPAGAVLAVPMPGPLEAVAAVEKAAGNGVRIGCFRPPSTPDGISRLRLTAHAQLGDDELARAVGVLDGLL
jgi:8-amino-7-oxononanoate synthase